MDQPCFDWGQIVYGSQIEGWEYPMLDPTNAENSRTFVTEPGSFALDTTSAGRHVLYYKPRSGENLGTAQVVAPQLEQLVVGEELHDVSFEGITFAYATWLAPNEGTGLVHWYANQYYDGGEVNPAIGDYPTREDLATIPANVTFHGSERIRIEGARFEHLGGSGIAFVDDSSYNVVRGSVIADVSAAGIQAGALAPAVGGSNAGNTFENNWVHGIGREYKGGTGFYVQESQDTTIEHNQVNDAAYTGIILAGSERATTNARRQRALDNHVFDVMKVLADGGGIYTTAAQGTTMANGATVTGNLVHDVVRGVNIGLYTDYGNAFVTMQGNVVYRTDYMFGGCSEPQLHDLLITDNWIDEDRQAFGGEYCGVVGERVVVEDNTVLGLTDPEGACAAIVACAAVVANAGLEPEYEHLLTDG